MSPVHDYVIDNSTGANVRSDINSVLQAILTNNSNSSAPSTTAAYMWWADTTTGTLKIRNSANNGWVELLQLDGTITLEDGSASVPALANRGDLDTGVFFGAANQFNIATGGTERVKIDSTAVVFNEGGADVDFRIESDTKTHLFFLDAGNNRISIGTGSPVSSSILSIQGGGNTSFSINTGNNSGDNTTINFGDSADADVGYINYDHGTNALQIAVAASLAAVIDSDGNVGLGTTSTGSYPVSATARKVQVEIKGAINTSNNTHQGQLALNCTNASAALHIIRSENDQTNGRGIGQVIFSASDGTDIHPVSSIQAARDDTGANNDTPGRLEFLTTADGANQPSERMVIDMAGNVAIGTSNANNRLEIAKAAHYVVTNSGQARNGIHIRGNGGNENEYGGGISFGCNSTGAAAIAALQGGSDADQVGLAFFTHDSTSGSANAAERARFSSDGDFFLGTTTVNPGINNYQTPGTMIRTAAGDYIAVSREQGTPAFFNRDNNTGTVVSFRYNGGERGTISTDGSVISVTGTSDYRLKENNVNISDGITRLKQLKPYRFNFKENPSKTLDGFFAHEVSTVVPEAVFGEKDAVSSEDSEDGSLKKDSPIYQQLDNSKLVPLLVAAVKELITKVETLEAA